MPRHLRSEAPGAVHHAVPKGNGGTRIVTDDHDRRVLLGRLEGVAARKGWRCLAYCVLDTHLHIVLETPEPNLGDGMKHVLGWYAHRFNRRHGRSGHVFDGRFWSRRCDEPEYLLRASLYCVLNPVAAGLCSHPNAWPWCSYRGTAGLGPLSFVQPGRLLATLGGTVDDARREYDALVAAGAARLRAEPTSPRGRWWTAVQDLMDERPVCGQAGCVRLKPDADASEHASGFSPTQPATGSHDGGSSSGSTCRSRKRTSAPRRA